MLISDDLRRDGETNVNDIESGKWMNEMLNE